MLAAWADPCLCFRVEGKLLQALGPRWSSCLGAWKGKQFAEGALKPVAVRSAALGLAEIQPGLIKMQSSFYYLAYMKHLQTSTATVFTRPFLSLFHLA